MHPTPFPHLREGNSRIALVEQGRAIGYGELNGRIDRFASGLLGTRQDLEEERIAFFLPASLDYVTVMHGVWRAGAISVPLNVASALAELDHYLSCARVTRLVASAENHPLLRDLCDRLGIELLEVSGLLADEIAPLPAIAPERRAMMVFTSGTTNKPKGVVTTHANIAAQITTLLDAWAWSEDDAIPLFLPLHHVHGIINVLSCALWAGAKVDLFPKFDAGRIAAEAAAGAYSVFMAVPTIYVKMLQYLDGLEPAEARRIGDGFEAMRLNVSGSAACPVPLFEQWKARTGQVLLERYGMTEIGMAISNPYHGERRAGYVGQPLPGVQVMLAGEDGAAITEEGVPGEIHIKGANVFLEYWDNPKATQESFVDGWFRTGDMAVVENGYYRIMGRTSIDIIKSGGYKLSALEIEGVLLDHPGIAEIAVIGVADDVWGEAVGAVIVAREGTDLTPEALKEWCEGKLSAYKIPKRIRFTQALPRNAMGKVTKPDLKPLLLAG
ncbi:acyl-CoA synthetase [Tsuneonella sp. CC-YZS046]|uniref:acyl-CoA synthetase n=1 Tax=Tsuneonella sp. CC-YZS046 TaxID=3042152 RepID=UPI002D78FB2F|nr:acyl-CoA synthetase [Tsuneonella sp. CC-YZS046]WRO65658.1 acyl-CoA synthetase [Tsuneonella sp. CC-YZS046]